MSISRLVPCISRFELVSICRLPSSAVPRLRLIEHFPLFRQRPNLYRNRQQLRSHSFASCNLATLAAKPTPRVLHNAHQRRWQTVDARPAERPSDGSQDPEQLSLELMVFQEPPIASAVFYFIAFGLFAFGVAAYSSLKHTDEVAEKLRQKGLFKDLLLSYIPNSSDFDYPRDDFVEDCWGAGVSRPKLVLMHSLLRAQEARQALIYFRDDFNLPTSIKVPVGKAIEALAEKVVNMSNDQQAVMPVIFVNTLVFLLWARSGWSSRLTNFLNVNFVHRPCTGMTHTLLTSSFSHQAFWHFAFNNYALWSFGGTAIAVAAYRHSIKGDIPETSPVPQFLAFFATAGVFAAMTSHVVTALRFRSVVQRLGVLEAKKMYGPRGSLGSSGAIWAAITMTACTMPDTTIFLLFLPFIPFPITYGVAGLLALDVAGLVRGWQVFDHVAHLGGAFFGLFYFQFGPQFWAAVKMWVAQISQIGPYDSKRKMEHITE